MDLSKLSDADLIALKAGDLTKVSDAGLMALKSPAAAPVAAPTPRVPSNVDVALNATGKALAGLPDAVLNTPNRLLNLGKAAFGTAATALGRSDLAPDLTPDPNLVTRAVRAGGGIREDSEPVTTKQRIIDTMVQGGVGLSVNPANSVRQAVSNFGTGAVGGAAAQVAKEGTGSDEASILAGMVAPAAIQAVGASGRARVADAAFRRSQNTTRDETLAAGRAEGYVVSPSKINDSFINRRLESIAGKEATGQEIATRNQSVTNALAARELGMPPETAITQGGLRGYRAQESQPYRDVAALSPNAQIALEQLRDARAAVRQHARHYQVSADPNALRNQTHFQQEADRLEQRLEQIAAQRGRPGLVDDLRASRANIAKSWDVQRGLNPGTSEVDAHAIGGALDRGAPLTGNLETVGRFANAFKSATREGSSVPPPGVNKLTPIASGLLGAGGAAAAGPGGAALALLPYLSGPARSLILSPAYQRNMVNPNYNQGRVMSQIPEQDAVVQALLLGRAIADRKQGVSQ